MRKANDDVMARSLAESRIRDLTSDVNEPVGDLGTQIISEFKAVEFETKKIMSQGEEIPLRRLVLTSAWEVDPNGGR